MENFLFREDYFNAEVIGFDLDGTLYDEFDFVYQVYNRIVNSCIDKLYKEKILNFMLGKWLEKGSSYPYIFMETLKKFKLKRDFETHALDIYRNFNPQIILSNRMRFVLNKIKCDNKKLFLLTDGRKKLQNKKIDLLKIRDYFDLIIIAEKYQKPDIYHGEKIKEFFEKNKEIIYIGDRDIDKSFSYKMGFKFINVLEIY